MRSLTLRKGLAGFEGALPGREVLAKTYLPVVYTRGQHVQQIQAQAAFSTTGSKVDE